MTRWTCLRLPLIFNCSDRLVRSGLLPRVFVTRVLTVITELLASLLPFWFISTSDIPPESRLEVQYPAEVIFRRLQDLSFRFVKTAGCN